MTTWVSVKGILEADSSQVIVPFAMVAGLVWLVCKSEAPYLAETVSESLAPVISN